MPSLQYSHVDFSELRAVGAVTLIHGGAGPVAKAMELSAEATQTGLAVLEASRLAAREGRRDPDFPYPSLNLGLERHPLRELTLAEAQTLQAAVRLEACPAFNAGKGSAIQEDGTARVTAAMMESARLNLSAVLNVEGLCHPSVLVAALQAERYPVRDGQAAIVLARALGLPVEDPVTPYQFEVWRKKREAQLRGSDPEAGRTGTVGAVSCDAEGFLSVVTSTGGTGFEPRGRLGDVPTVAGTYCTKRTAVSCTGYGEQIVSHALAARLAVRLEDSSSPAAALEKTLAEAGDRDLEMAFICVHKSEQGVLWARGSTTAHFAWGVSDGSSLLFKND